MARRKRRSTSTKKAKSYAQIVEEAGSDRLVLAASEHAKFPGAISTGIPTLDAAIGRGGIPLGRLTVISGAPSAGKTSLSMKISAQIQRQHNGFVIYGDTEGKLDVEYAIEAFGVDPERFAILRPEHIEGGAQHIINIAARVKEMDEVHPILVVLDSINMTTTEDEMTHIFDANFKGMATQSRAFAKVLPKLVAFLHPHPFALLFVSQHRMSVGSFAYLVKMGGGNATKFLCAVHVDIKSEVYEETEDNPVGILCKASVMKNQVNRPLRTAEYRIIWGEGIDVDHALLLYAVQVGAVQKGTRQWYTFEAEGKKYRWQGDGKGWANLLKREPKIKKLLVKSIKSLLRARAKRQKTR